MNILTLNSFLPYQASEQKQLVWGDINAFTAGLFVPFAFAPFHFSWILYLLLARFFACLINVSPLRAAWRGWLFGFAQFGWGLYWLRHSFDLQVDLSQLFSATVPLLFSAYLALFIALTAYVSVKLFGGNKLLLLLVGLPANWTLFECLRSNLFTGFPWMSLGYSQVDTLLRGYAPIIGGLGLTFLSVLVASAITLLVYSSGKSFRYRVSFVMLLIVVLMGGVATIHIAWSEKAGDPILVSLVQANISARDKWAASNREKIKTTYFTAASQHHDSDLIIWPETAIPNFIGQETYYLNRLREIFVAKGSDILTGIVGTDRNMVGYTNRIANIGGGHYDKQHLVPVAEYLPDTWIGRVLSEVMQFPLSNIRPGNSQQDLILAANSRIGSSICFEIAFDDLVRQSSVNANYLVNISDDSLYVDSLEPYQTIQIARLRALENSRYLLRASNTGISVFIDEDGKIISATGLNRQQVLTGEVQPLVGSTLYSRFGNSTILTISILMLLIVMTYQIRMGFRIKSIKSQ